MTLKHPMCPPTEADPDLYVKTDITPETVFQAVGRLRREAQDEIDRLLTFLNETDGYSVTELEPSLGFPEPETSGDEMDGFDWPYRSFDLQPAHAGASDDRELVDEDEDGADAEPSLGSVEAHPHAQMKRADLASLVDQENWSAGTSSDCEGDEHDGCEPDADLEPSLGFLEHHREHFGLCGGLGDELEDEHDGAEPDVENEPSLGSFDRLMNQSHGWRQIEPDENWWFYRNNDAELDSADPGGRISPRQRAG